VPEWVVDLEGHSAYLDIRADNLSIDEIDKLLQELVDYHEDVELTRVVVRVASNHRPTVEVLLQGLRSQAEAVGIDFSVREFG
jgi:hypothetical protein